MKFNLSRISRNLGKLVVKRSPEILTGLGIAGLLTTTVMAVKATPKALDLIDAEIDRLDLEESKKARENGYENRQQITHLTTKEIIATTWKCYVPSAVTSLVSVGCLVGASSVNFRRNAALAAAYSLSESAMREYQEKVVGIIGNDKNREIKDEIIKERIDKKPVNQEIIIAGDGDVLCYDVSNDRYFKSNVNKLQKIENDLNRRMRTEMYISLNDFYYEVGLKTTKLGDTYGWNIDNGDIELHFSSCLKDGVTPCLAVDFNNEPHKGFQDYS